MPRVRSSLFALRAGIETRRPLSVQSSTALLEHSSLAHFDKSQGAFHRHQQSPTSMIDTRLRVELRRDITIVGPSQIPQHTRAGCPWFTPINLRSMIIESAPVSGTAEPPVPGFFPNFAFRLGMNPSKSFLECLTIGPFFSIVGRSLRAVAPRLGKVHLR